MTIFNITQAVAVTALLLIAAVAADRLVALTRATRKNNDPKEEDETGLRDVRDADDPRS